MTAQRSANAQSILDRLSRLEQSQHALMTRLQSDHDRHMADLRDRLQQARARCEESDVESALIATEPVVMHVNMTEVEAAVQAASFAEQESFQALEEARQVAQSARRAAGAPPKTLRDKDAAANETCGATTYGADVEYIVKKVSVNLDEVERAINNSSYVSVCRAFGLPDSKYGNEVYCAVVPKKNVKVSEQMLSIHAQKYLPTAMVPKRFYFLPALPPDITRKALADTQLAGDFEPPMLPALHPAPPHPHLLDM